MSKRIKIDKCFSCPKLDHDGALRKGGAFYVCRATKCETPEEQDGVYSRRLNPDAGPIEDRRRSSIRSFDGTIPVWCPLEDL